MKLNKLYYSISNASYNIILFSFASFFLLANHSLSYAVMTTTATESRIIYEHTDADGFDDFIQIRTVGKEDSSCGFSAAWMTNRLAHLLQENPNATTHEIRRAIEPSDANKTNFINFTKESAEMLTQATSEDLDVKKALTEGAEFAEVLFSIQTPERQAEIEAEGRKYVTMSIPHGKLLLEILHHYTTPLENVIVFLDGFYESNIYGPLSVYHNNAYIDFSSPKEFLDQTALLLKNEIKEDGDFKIFVFSGEVADVFISWIVVCVRQVKGKMQFIILDPANNGRYLETNKRYFPGALYTRVSATKEESPKKRRTSLKE